MLLDKHTEHKAKFSNSTNQYINNKIERSVLEAYFERGASIQISHFYFSANSFFDFIDFLITHGLQKFAWSEKKMEFRLEKEVLSIQEKDKLIVNAQDLYINRKNTKFTAIYLPDPDYIIFFSNKCSQNPKKSSEKEKTREMLFLNELENLDTKFFRDTKVDQSLEILRAPLVDNMKVQRRLIHYENDSFSGNMKELLIHRTYTELFDGNYLQRIQNESANAQNYYSKISGEGNCPEFSKIDVNGAQRYNNYPPKKTIGVVKSPHQQIKKQRHRKKKGERNFLKTCTKQTIRKKAHIMNLETIITSKKEESHMKNKKKTKKLV